MTINFLKANNGDSILLSFHDKDGISRNILIDGGPAKAYEYKNVGTGKIYPGQLKEVIGQIQQRGQKIDLLILTHIDDDHIGGILKWFSKDASAVKLIDNVWFNSGRSIFKYFAKEELKENISYVIKDDSLDTSVKQGERFEDFISMNTLWDEALIYAPKKIEKWGLSFNILSPNIKNLEALLHKWEKEVPNLDTSHKSDYNETLADLIRNDKFEEDNTVFNGSAIAFVLTYKDKNFLFLSDAHPTTIIQNLKFLGYSPEKPINAELVKVSHHGSKYNTSREMLQLITSDNFIISSDGSIHNLPDKISLARIISHNPKANIYFNYPEKIDTIFGQDDRDQYNGVSLKEAQQFNY